MWRANTAWRTASFAGLSIICCRTARDATALLTRLNALAAEREGEIVALRAEQEKIRARARQDHERQERERAVLHDAVRAKAGELMRAWKEGRATHKQALKEMSRLRAELARPAVEEPSVLPVPQAFTPGSRCCTPCSTSVVWLPMWTRAASGYAWTSTG